MHVLSNGAQAFPDKASVLPKGSKGLVRAQDFHQQFGTRMASLLSLLKHLPPHLT